MGVSLREQQKMKYSGIVATGGIGSGKSFMLNGSHTLGREESRSGHFLDVRDYCKQHIILHYIKILLGPRIIVFPVGKVGSDDLGDQLFREMSETGFVMTHVEKITGASTLFSFCFHYPDGTGGNLTTDDSASARVDSMCIEKAEAEIKGLGVRGIVMAAPEVPLIARQQLLEMGKKYQSFCTASFTSEEIKRVADSGIMSDVDLLAINLDEAAALVDESPNHNDAAAIVRKAIQRLRSDNKNIQVTITAGVNGSWCWDTKDAYHCPAIKANVISTAGAGDAFFSGLLCGITSGLSLHESQQLATMVGGFSVTSPHTIHPDFDRLALRKFLEASDFKYSDNIINILTD